MSLSSTKHILDAVMISMQQSMKWVEPEELFTSACMQVAGKSHQDELTAGPASWKTFYLNPRCAGLAVLNRYMRLG
jgi:hypothetical protein